VSFGDLYKEHEIAFLGYNSTIENAEQVMKIDESWKFGEKFLIKQNNKDFFVFLFQENAPIKRNVISVVCFDKSGRKIFKSIDQGKMSLKKLIDLIEKKEDICDGSLEACETVKSKLGVNLQYAKNNHDLGVRTT